MGMSDGENSMNFPFIVTEENFHATNKLSLVEGINGVELVVDHTLPAEAFGSGLAGENGVDGQSGADGKIE